MKLISVSTLKCYRESKTTQPMADPHPWRVVGLDRRPGRPARAPCIAINIEKTRNRARPIRTSLKKADPPAFWATRKVPVPTVMAARDDGEHVDAGDRLVVTSIAPSFRHPCILLKPRKRI